MNFIKKYKNFEINPKLNENQLDIPFNFILCNKNYTLYHYKDDYDNPFYKKRKDKIHHYKNGNIECLVNPNESDIMHYLLSYIIPSNVLYAGLDAVRFWISEIYDKKDIDEENKINYNRPILFFAVKGTDLYKGIKLLEIKKGKI